jgi:hypothetical protein
MTITSAIALWARHHRTHARFLIAFATTLLILAGSALGNLWTPNGLHMGPGVLAGIFAIYLLIFPMYPVIRRRTNWMRRKSFDAILIGCTALLGVWFGVQEEAPQLLTGPQTAQAATVARPASTDGAPAYRFEKRVQRGMSLLKMVFRRPARFDDPRIFSTGEKIGLTILTVILMLVMMWLVLSASCSLSCSGNAVGSALVLIIGGGAVLALGIMAILRINRNAEWFERRNHRRAQRAG